MRKEIEQHIDASTSRAVRLERTGIEDAELPEIIAHVIEKRPHIEQLLFPHNRITDKGCETLAILLAPLVKNHNLHYLNIAENFIGEVGYRHLCEGLMTINPRFEIAAAGNRLDNMKADEIEQEAKAKVADADKTSKPKH